MRFPRRLSSRSSCTAPSAHARRAARARSPRCWHRWDCACRQTKTRVCHLDEGFDFLGLPHPAAPQEGNQRSTTSTPTRRRRRWLSITGKVRAADRSRARHIARSPTCCASSTRCCGAGATTSGTACPRPPSATSTPSPGVGSPWWLRKRHPGINWKDLYRRFLTGEARSADRPRAGIACSLAQQVPVTRYRWRGDQHPHTVDESATA